MNIPDKLTFFRILATPLIFFTWYSAIYLGISPKVGTVIMGILFFLSEVSDVMDGHIARRYNLVSDFGKIADPFSDVFLRLTYFLCFVASNLMPVWTLAIIIWRELGIILIRMILIQRKKALAANFFGKFKSTLYFICGVGGLFTLFMRIWRPELEWLLKMEWGLKWLFIMAAITATISFVNYFCAFLRLVHIE